MQQLNALQAERERAAAQASKDNAANIAARNRQAEQAAIGAKTLNQVKFAHDKDQGNQVGAWLISTSSLSPPICLPYLFWICVPAALSFAAKNHDKQSTRLAVTNAKAVNARKAAAVDQAARAAARQRAAARAAREEDSRAQFGFGVSIPLDNSILS